MPMYELRYKRLVARREHQLQHGVSSGFRNALRWGLGGDIVGDTSWLFLGDVNRVALIVERAVFTEGRDILPWMSNIRTV